MTKSQSATVIKPKFLLIEGLGGHVMVARSKLNIITHTPWNRKDALG